MTDVVLLSRYERLGASSRLRSYQYLPALEARGIRVRVCPMLDDRYLRARHAGSRPLLPVLAAYRRRLGQLLSQRSAPILWVEYEALPWLPFAVERLLIGGSRCLVIDYDDAIFHRYDQHRSAIVRGLLGKKIDRLMRAADVVIAGNDYLAERARRAGSRRVELMPTVIDPARYRPKTEVATGPLVLGWIGSPSTTHYLQSLEPAFRIASAARAIRVVNVGGAPWTPEGLDVQTLPWSEDTEVQDILRFDVGIMPLDDDPWSRGKCGFKLIQYMGCALPTVASPVGANPSIVEAGKTGLLASTQEEWARALVRLADDPELRRSMGHAGRERVCKRYSLDVTAPRLAALFAELLHASGPRSVPQ